MSTPEAPAKLHSAEYFGEQRDFWWNQDYVALLARRFGLDGVRMALDVGCGVGHWSRVLLPHLSAEARLFGIDREEAWVKEAAARAAQKGYGERTSYRLGEAEKIPFHDDTFDLVTCQTVLIHVRDPRAVIREMMRVTKPGGLVLMAEPNNMAGALVLWNTQFSAPIAGILDAVRLYLTCTRGKESLGLGNDSIGELVPGYASEIGLTDVQVYLNDRPSPLFPPYAGRAQEVLRQQVLDWDERDFLVWSYDETARYFVAGGGREEEFDALWKAARAASREAAAALREGRAHQAGGTIGYVIGGRKPA
ncbi:SAM-dependent methyltransferase [Minicystis rosea]|nr:SAM-dependent methyltransferase [Minicystis rosea]